MTNSDLRNELRVLNAEINGKLDLMIQKADYAERAQAALRVDVNKNSDEILALRQRAHDNANGIQALELRTAPLSLALSTELVSGIAEIRQGVDILRASDVRTPFKQGEIDEVRALLGTRKKRQATWFGFSREVVVGILGVVALLVFTSVWAYIRQRYLGIP